MSAFICSDDHINTLVSYAHKMSLIGVGETQDLAEKLLYENTRSVNYRYGEDQVNTITFKETDIDLTPIEIIRLVHCIDYQSCETNDWEQTESYKWLRAIEDTAIRQVPGYDQAEWRL